MKRLLSALPLTAVAILVIAPGPAAAQVFDTQHGKLRVVTVAKGLVHPWSVAFLPDGRMLVTERPGRLRYVSKDGRLSAPIAGLPPVWARGQAGLLDVTLDPDFARNRLIYFAYTEPTGGGARLAVARARLEPGRLTGLKVIFRQVPPTNSALNIGSRLVIARDGTLFVTVGDRFERQRAQDPSVNRGQIVRINRDGSIPKDNPFVGRKGYRPEIWSYGHRNPEGAALNPATGKLWEIEHGARGGDEVNIPQAGRNYGWPVIAYGRHYSGAKIGVGTHKAGMEQPIYYWDPSIAPSGMAFYTGDKFPAWKGNLLVGALAYRLVARLTLDGDKVVKEERILDKLGERIRDVRQGPDGYVYLLTDAEDGRLLRLEPVGDWTG